MTAPALPPFVVTCNGPLTLVKFTESILDEQTLRPVEEQLYALAERPGQDELQLDFSAVSFLSSYGLGRLLGLHKRLQAAGGRLVLQNVPELLHELFRVTRLLEVLDLRSGSTTGPDPKRATG